MSAEPRVLARNTTQFTIALIAQKVISFLYFTYLARIFEPSAIGQYVFALSFTTIFSVLIDIGLGYVLTTEIAKDKSKAQEFWQNVIGFKLVAAVVVLVITWLTINALGYEGVAKELVYIASILMIIDSLVLSAYSLIRAFQNLWWESLGTILFQVVASSTGIILLQYTHDLRIIILALVVTGLVNLVYSWNRLSSFGIRLRPKLNWPVMKRLLVLAWPFGAALVLTRVYGYIDSVLLSLLSGDEAVGYYSVAYKITFAWQFIASAFAASLLPGFSQYIVTARDILPGIFSKSVHYLNLISLPLAGGFIVLAQPIISAVYPKYLSAVLPLQILMVSLVFLFLTFPVGSLLSAAARQKRNTGNLLITVIVTVVLNFLLIPSYQAVGAAIASLISTFVYFILGWVVIKQLIIVDYKLIAFNTLKILLATVGMVLFMWWGSGMMNLILVLVFGMLVYLALSLLLKTLSWAEIKNVKSLIFSRNDEK